MQNFGFSSWEAALCVNPAVFLPSRVNELYVDDPDKDSGGKIEVNLNISLPNLHCECEYPFHCAALLCALRNT